MPEEKNVLLMKFPDASAAYQALSQMKDQPGVNSAAVVERTEDGQIRVGDGFSPTLGTGTAVGGLVGSLIGILGGPVGVLLGWSAGLLTGVLYDTDEAADTDDGLTVLSKSIEPGENLLMVEMVETSHAIADDVAGKLDGTVTRIPAKEVEAEIDAAHHAARAAAAAARKARREKWQASFKQRMESLPHHAKSS